MVYGIRLQDKLYGTDYLTIAVNITFKGLFFWSSTVHVVARDGIEIEKSIPSCSKDTIIANHTVQNTKHCP
jgi:hypothetical protein